MSGFNFKENAKDVGTGGNFLQKAGIHIAAPFVGVEYASATGWEAMDIHILVEDKQFKERYFAKEYNEADIDPDKTADKWEKGVKTNKKLTPKEQVMKNQDDFTCLLIQISKAVGFTFEDFISKMGSTSSFKESVEKFATTFNPKEGQEKLVNFGTFWNNNDNKKSSNLRLAYHNSNKIVIAQYEPGKPSGINLSDKEKANSERKYEYVKDGEGVEVTNTSTISTSTEVDNSKPVAGSSIFGDD